jgi:hypothetical protein
LEGFRHFSGISCIVSITIWRDCLMRFFGLFFWPVWIHLDLNMNRLWFFNFNGAPFILDNYFKFWHVSGQTFSEILRISEKDLQLSLRFSNFRRFLISGSPIFVELFN